MNKINLSAFLLIHALSSSAAHASIFSTITDMAASAKAHVMSFFTTTEPGVTHFRNHTADALTVIYSGDNSPTITIQPGADAALSDKGFHKLVSINGIALSDFKVNQEMGSNCQFIFYHSIDSNGDEFYDFSSTASAVQQKFTNVGDAIKNIQNVQVSNQQALNALDNESKALQSKIDNYDSHLTQTINTKTNLSADNDFTKAAKASVNDIVSDSNLAEHIGSRIEQNFNAVKLDTNDYWVTSLAVSTLQGRDFMVLTLKGDNPLRCDPLVGENNNLAYIDLSMPNTKYLASHTATAYAIKRPMHVKVSANNYVDPDTDIDQVLCVIKISKVRS